MRWWGQRIYTYIRAACIGAAVGPDYGPAAGEGAAGVEKGQGLDRPEADEGVRGRRRDTEADRVRGIYLYVYMSVYLCIYI